MKLVINKEELCKKCKIKKGFCKHTIEDKYKDNFPDKVFDKPYLSRFLAIEKTDKQNIWKNLNNDISELKRQVKVLQEELNGFEWLRYWLSKKKTEEA